MFLPPVSSHAISACLNLQLANEIHFLDEWTAIFYKHRQQLKDRDPFYDGLNSYNFLFRSSNTWFMFLFFLSYLLVFI